MQCITSNHPKEASLPGLEVAHATHLVVSGLFWMRHVSHVHWPAFVWNLANRSSLTLLLLAGAETIILSEMKDKF